MASSVAPVPFWSRQSVRLGIAVALCSCMTVTNLMRNTLAMSVVCMMNTTWLAEVQQVAALLDENFSVNRTNDLHSSEHCHLSRNERRAYAGEIEWTTTEQAGLFSIVYWTGKESLSITTAT